MALAASIYAEKLSYRGHGLALWNPEPSKSGEVQIGDVGYVDKGGFYRLFNVTYDADHPINLCGVPPDFEILKIDPRHIHKKDNYLPPGPLCSRSVREVVVDVGGSTANSAGAAYRFKCTEDSGALLVLKDYATSEEVHQGHVFEKYIRKHHANWYTFARDVCGLSVDPEALMLVKGCVKTSEWAVAAFLEEGTEHEISLCAGAEPYAKANFSVSVSKHTSMSVEYRFGPLPSPKFTTSPFDPPSSDKRPRDQCIFVSAYKLRRRFPLPPKVSAAADQYAHDGAPPPGAVDGALSSAEDAEGSDFDVYEHPTTPIPRDPLDDLLDDILENSDEDVAVASHSDSRERFSTDPDDTEGERCCFTAHSDLVHDIVREHDVSTGGSQTTPDIKCIDVPPMVLPINLQTEDSNSDVNNIGRWNGSSSSITTKPALGSRWHREKEHAPEWYYWRGEQTSMFDHPTSPGLLLSPRDDSHDSSTFSSPRGRPCNANTQRDHTHFGSPIEFWTNGRRGISLAEVEAKPPAGLEHADDILLESFGQNVTYRIECAGYPSFMRRRSLISAGRRKGITRAELARQVAGVWKEFAGTCSSLSTIEPDRELTPQEMAPHTSPELAWRAGPRHIDFSDILLLELRRVSGMSLQLVLSYRRSDWERRPPPNYPPKQEPATAIVNVRQSWGGAQTAGSGMSDDEISSDNDADEDGGSGRRRHNSCDHDG